GDEFSYALTIANLGTDPALNITLTDTLPEFITPLNWPGTQSGNTLVLNIAMLAPTQDTTITFTVNVAAPLTNTILKLINTSQVMAACDEDTTNNSATATVIMKPPILECDLKLAKTASVDTVRANTEFTYHLNVDNIGIHTAFHITLVDTIPEFITPSNFNRQPDSKINNILFWQFDSLAPGHNTIVTFTAKVNTSLPDNVTEIVNKSGVIADCDVDNISNNFESFSVIVTEFMENCSLFNLDVNVYEPEKGDRLGINFELNSSRTVRLDVLDISGYRIKTLTEATFNAGLNRIEWDGLTENGQKVGSGVYIITLRSGNLKCWKKVIVAR
ncbi:MAG: FlgD immunoglobulin-like domain containing protein, partial [bacterium]